uniref:Taste receptor type 2 n=1 Tax=Takifugu rubripes TaxID=31033 RepID=A0A674MSW2_TAKRU
MERRYIEVECWLYQLIMFPLSGINFFLNIFYIHCLISNRQKLRQPLKLLLCFLIGCSATFSIHLALWSPILVEMDGSSIPHHFFWMLIIFFTHSSMTCSGWMSIYAYVKVVPSKRALLIWIKRNIKSVVYLFFFSQETLIIFEASLKISTLVLDDTVFNKLPSHLIKLAKATMIMNEVYFVICLFIMSLSSLSTAIYLSRHLRRMASKVRSCSLFRSQVRVTVTGILQGALYVLLSTWILSHYFFYDIAAGPAAYMTLANITVINVYMMGTIVNLGVGQAVFRQRAVDLWHRAARCCTTMRAQQPQKG